MSSEIEPVAWLRSQITARLETARKATPGPWEPEGDDPIDDQVIEPDGWTLAHMRGPKSYENMVHVALSDPQDTIVRCEAELAILDAHYILHRGDTNELYAPDRPGILTVCHCGRLWRSVHPGNPAYAGWRPVGPLYRLLFRKRLRRAGL